MNGKLVVMLTLATIMLATSGQLFSQEDLRSLRGMNPIEDASKDPEAKRWEPDG